ALETAVSQTPGASSARDASGVPVDLARYGNGRIPPDALAPVGSTGHRLWAPAAQAFGDLTAAAARDGVRIGITDSYRSYDAQIDVAARKGLYSQGGLAAAPGTSPHGWGLALDLALDDRAQAWMRANAGTYGFEEDTPREPWHWVYSR
ncbi:M15 family metallopeptidase, partial [Cellulomonas septica]